MPYKIKSPNPHFSGLRNGIRFEKGEAIVADKDTAQLIKAEFGYEFEEVKETKTK